MSGVVLALIGVCVLGILLDVIVPKGDTAKYIKGIFGIFAAISVISPIAEMFGAKIDVFGIEVDAYQPDGRYIQAVYERKVDEFEVELGKIIEEKCNISCNLDVDFSYSRLKINSITIIFRDQVILDESQRIYIAEKAKDAIKSVENIDGDLIFCVWQ